MSMSQAARLDVRERAEAQRSDVEAQLTVEARLRAEEWNVLRYMAPPQDTPFPLEYAFYLLGDVAGKHVLDLGCGSGENTLLLVRRGAVVSGLDLSQSLIELANKRLRVNGLEGRARFIVGSAHDIALPDASVDVVFGIAILHHLDLAVVSREVRRILRPGGRAIFQEPVRNSALVRFARSLIPYRAPDVSPFERPFTDEELTEFARAFSGCRSRVFWLPFMNVALMFLRPGGPLFRLFRLDGALLKTFPSLARFAGVRVLELTK